MQTSEMCDKKLVIYFLQFTKYVVSLFVLHVAHKRAQFVVVLVSVKKNCLIDLLHGHCKG